MEFKTAMLRNHSLKEGVATGGLGEDGSVKDGILGVWGETFEGVVHKEYHFSLTIDRDTCQEGKLDKVFGVQDDSFALVVLLNYGVGVENWAFVDEAKIFSGAPLETITRILSIVYQPVIECLGIDDGSIDELAAISENHGHAGHLLALLADGGFIVVIQIVIAPEFVTLLVEGVSSWGQGNGCNSEKLC